MLQERAQVKLQDWGWEGLSFWDQIPGFLSSTEQTQSLSDYGKNCLQFTSVSGLPEVSRVGHI